MEGATPSNDPTAVVPRLHKGWLVVSLLGGLVGIPASIRLCGLAPPVGIDKRRTQWYDQ